MNNQDLQIGLRVKPSDYALESKAEAMRKYLKGTKPYEQRKAWYETAAAQRGTITGIDPPKYTPYQTPVIAWDNGSTGTCMASMIDPAE